MDGSGRKTRGLQNRLELGESKEVARSRVLYVCDLYVCGLADRFRCGRPLACSTRDAYQAHMRELRFETRVRIRTLTRWTLVARFPGHGPTKQQFGPHWACLTPGREFLQWTCQALTKDLSQGLDNLTIWR